MGDFNAGGRYISGYELEQLRIRKDKRFKWLIPDSMDTTVKGTCYAYDRYIDQWINQSIDYADEISWYEEHSNGFLENHIVMLELLNDIIF